jgi:ornithine cyclodeaminase/alanine dehydrogenase
VIDQDSGPQFVSADAVRSVFVWADAIAALQHAYAQPIGHAAAPPRSIAQSGPTWLRCLPAVPPGQRYFGAKLMGAAMGAKAGGVEYVVVLFDAQTSRIAAFVDANQLTGYRTAATSASALDKLAPRKPLRLGVIGSGLEASMHARAFAAVRELSEVVVFSPNPANRQAFADAITRDLGVPARAAASPEEALGDADIALAAARSRDEQPIIFGDWLKPDAMVVSIGSTIPQQREADLSIVARADLIVCDMLEEVMDETGDMIAAKAAGIDIAPKCFSLTALMTGELEDRVAAARAPMFKSVGGGMQDVVIAAMLLEKALAAGAATALPISFETMSF